MIEHASVVNAPSLSRAEKARERKRRWRLKNKAAVRAYNHAWKVKNKKHVKEYQKKAAHAHYLANKQVYKERAAAHRLKGRQAGMCIDCVARFPMVNYRRCTLCNDKHTENGRLWRRKNGAKILDQSLQRQYGITTDEYTRLAKKQNWVCAICGKRERRLSRLVVDHCHSSGKIRGLLCSTCNTGLGYFYDDVALFNKAISYLKKV